MATLAELNKERWNNAKIPSAKGPEFKAVADKITLYKDKYMAVQKATGVPWWFIGVVHYRESAFDFTRSLAQGDPWNKKSTHVPANRGPFSSWEEAAVDALVDCAPFAARNKDWSIGGALAMLEKYNGLGYANKGIPSPYLWAGTNQYIKGKYVADGKFSANTVDKQLGCAGILKFLGVFKTAPTGAGTVITAGTAGGAVVAASQSPVWWDYITNHWVAIALAVVGTALIVDLAIAIYNNEKNQLKIKDVPDVKTN